MLQKAVRPHSYFPNSVTVKLIKRSFFLSFCRLVDEWMVVFLSCVKFSPNIWVAGASWVLVHSGEDTSLPRWPTSLGYTAVRRAARRNAGVLHNCGDEKLEQAGSGLLSIWHPKGKTWYIRRTFVHCQLSIVWRVIGPSFVAKCVPHIHHLLNQLSISIFKITFIYWAGSSTCAYGILKEIHDS